MTLPYSLRSSTRLATPGGLPASLGEICQEFLINGTDYWSTISDSGARIGSIDSRSLRVTSCSSAASRARVRATR